MKETERYDLIESIFKVIAFNITLALLFLLFAGAASATAVNCSVVILNVPLENTTTLVAEGNTFVLNTTQSLTTNWAWQKTISQDCSGCIAGNITCAEPDVYDDLLKYFEAHPINISCLSQFSLNESLNETQANLNVEIRNVTAQLADLATCGNEKASCQNELASCKSSLNSSDTKFELGRESCKNAVSSNKILQYVMMLSVLAVFVVIAIGAIKNWNRRKANYG